MLRSTFIITIVLMMFSASSSTEIQPEEREGCPDYFHRIGSKCYHFDFVGRSFEDSRIYCESLIVSGNGSSDLAVFGYDYVDFDSITNYLNVEDISYTIWVGLTDISMEGDWHWLDGTPQPRASVMWACGEPSDSTSYNCATIYRESESHASRYRFMDYDCESTSIFSLCEYRG